MIGSFAWVCRKHYYKGRHKCSQSNTAGGKLAVTLRFLASVESQQSLSFAYLTGKSELSRIIRETFDAIFEALAVRLKYMLLDRGYTILLSLLQLKMQKVIF